MDWMDRLTEAAKLAHDLEREAEADEIHVVYGKPGETIYIFGELTTENDYWPLGCPRA